MLSHLLVGNGDIRTYVISLLLSIPIVLLALSVHETAHGFVADKLGDPTARNYGRLTLNPIKHLDPIGTVCMLLFGFGWARPVPINSRYFRKPRRDMALTAIAGPISNLLMALVFGLLFNLWCFLLSEVIYINSYFALNMASYFYIFLYYGVSLNVTLAVFNLLPVPPLDGSRVVTAFLPPKGGLFLHQARAHNIPRTYGSPFCRSSFPRNKPSFGLLYRENILCYRLLVGAYINFF